MQVMPPSLGVYGPGSRDKSGVATYIAESLEYLQPFFRTHWVANDETWISPDQFDYTLYHIGNNELHRSSLRAAMLRPGVSLLHEYLHLDLYFQVWEDIDEARQREILSGLARKSGLSARSASHFVEQANSRGIDPYAIDIGIERYVIEASKVGLVHSSGVALRLRERYRRSQIEAVPFPVKPWGDYDRSIPEKFGIHKDDFVFGAFGFIGEYKCIPLILSAWQTWRGRPANVVLLLAGEKQFSINTEFSGVIETGWLDSLTFNALIQRTDCGVQLRKPSLGETSGPAAAFCAHNRPVILSDTPEMRGIGIGKNAHFLNVNAGNEELLALMQALYNGRGDKRAEYIEEFAWSLWANRVHSCVTGAAMGM
jgi:glycosyltransferase involved in cell wall biosynthesis